MVLKIKSPAAVCGGTFFAFHSNFLRHIQFKNGTPKPLKRQKKRYTLLFSTFGMNSENNLSTNPLPE